MFVKKSFTKLVVLQIVLCFQMVFSFACIADQSQKAVVAFRSLNDATDSLDVDGDAISIVMQTILSQSDEIMLVDRDVLEKALTEMQLAQQSMISEDSAQKLGSIVGAGYFCSGSLRTTGDKFMASVRLVDVDTTLVKQAYTFLASKEDIEAAGKSLATQITKLVEDFESDKRAGSTKPEEDTVPSIPEDWELPSVMVVIPEMHITQPQLIDPAGESEIIKRLLESGFKVIDSEYVKQMKQNPAGAEKTFGSVSTSTQYAAKKSADVLLYGEAVSERAAGLGEFEGCRARIEIKAIDVHTDEVLLSESTYGGATDLAETIAGKKAIQQAANRLADTLLYSLAEKWQNRN